MSSIKLQGSTSGEITIAAPAVAGTNTLTLPAHTGTVMVDGPAFSAYRSTSVQAVANATWTKVEFQTEEFDTNNCYDNATNYRFTPTVAGYYQVNGSVLIENMSDTQVSRHAVYKNGVKFKHSGQNYMGNAGYQQSVSSSLIYLNGSTDYIEIYVWHNYGSNRNIWYVADGTFFQAFLARAS